MFKQLGGMLVIAASRWSRFNTGSVDGAKGRLIAYDERKFVDLAVMIRCTAGAVRVELRGLGDELGFISVDEHTLQSKASPNVFALGDATALQASKAGSVAHFEGEVLVENIRRFLDQKNWTPPLTATSTASSSLVPPRHCSSTSIMRPSLDGTLPGPIGLPLMKEST